MSCVPYYKTIKNERSSITIDKLCKEIKRIIADGKSIIYLPQNDEYMCTYKIVKEQMQKEGIKVWYIPIFNPIIKLMIGRVGIITKAFGGLKYGK